MAFSGPDGLLLCQELVSKVKGSGIGWVFMTLMTMGGIKTY